MLIESNKAKAIAPGKKGRGIWQELSFIAAMSVIAAIVLAVIGGWIAPANFGL